MKPRSPFEDSRDVFYRSWAIGFGDLLTLLLCFFVLFISSESSQNYNDLHPKGVSNEFYPQNRLIVAEDKDGIALAETNLVEPASRGVSFLIAESMQGLESKLQEIFTFKETELKPEMIADLKARISTCARGLMQEQIALESTLISSLVIGEQLIKRGFGADNIKYQPLGSNCERLPRPSQNIEMKSQAFAVIRFN
jgi:hypothetical protein